MLAPPAVAGGVGVDEASWADKNAAKEKYGAGSRAFDERELDVALARFRESYAIVASPNSHLMIARVLIELKRYSEADTELQGVIAEAEATSERAKYEKTAETARNLRQDLAQKLATVAVSVPARVTVRGREVPPAEWGRPIPVEAGEAQIEVLPAQGEKRSQTVDLKPGATFAIDPSSAPAVAAKPPRPQYCRVENEPGAPPVGMVPQRSVAWVAGGIGAAGIVAFAVFGLLDERTYRKLESDCANGVCPASAANDAERGRTYQALANVGVGVAAVGLATGAVLLVTAPRRTATGAADGTRPAVVIGPRHLAIRGTFR